MGLTVLIHVLTSFAVIGIVIAIYHRWFLAPMLERQRLAIEASQERAGQRLQAELEERFDAILANMTDNSLSGTTRQMLRFGSDLMEGGISTFLSGAPESRANSRGQKESIR